MIDKKKCTSPSESENYKTLLEVAPLYQINPYLLKQLLWLINAHPSLIAFFQVCSNLSHELNCLEKYAKVNLAEYGIGDWPNVLRLVSRHQNSLAQKLTANASTIIGAKNKQLLHAKKTNYGIYCLLCTVHETPKYRDHYDLLVGHQILANIQATKKFTTIDMYENYHGKEEILSRYRKVYGSTLALRRLSKNARLTTMLQTNPYQSPKEFIADLLAIKITLKPTTNKDKPVANQNERKSVVLSGKDNYYLVLYRTFLANCTKIKRSKSSNKSKSSRQVDRINSDSGYLGTHSDIGLIDTYESDPDDPMSNRGTQTIIHSTTDDDSGNTSITPTSSGKKIILSRTKCTSPITDLATYHGSARSSARHIVLSNQLLPWDTPTLTEKETNLFLQHFHEIFIKLIKKTSCNKDEQLTLETVVLAKIMFWTASPLERAIGTRFINQKENYPYDLAILISQLKNNKYGEWRIKSWTPSYSTAPEEPSETRDHKDFVYLQDHIGFTNHLLLYCKARGISPIPSSIIFPSSTQKYKTELQAILHKFNKDKRITIHKIEKHLFDKTIEKTNDVSTASSITGIEHPLNKSRSHYFTPDLNYLRTIYKNIVTEISAAYTFPGLSQQTNLISTSQSTLDLSGKATGSRYCATFTAVKNAIRQLQDNIAKLSLRISRKEFANYHNLYTLYSILMFGFATGRRPFNTQLPSIDKIDNETGITILNEKDNQYRSKSRPSWIPPFMMDQLHNHQHHCENTIKLILTQNNQQKFHRHCFFLNINNTPEKVTPSSIETLLEPYIPLQANFYRCFMRTNLIERGCPSEIVDCWMGHWHIGQEPWGKYSSYSIVQYINMIKQHLLPILNELGLTPLPGLCGEE